MVAGDGQKDRQTIKVRAEEEDINYYKKRLVLIYGKRKQLGILVFVFFDLGEIFQ